MTSKAGKKFDARIVLNEQTETAFEFDKKQISQKIIRKTSLRGKQSLNSTLNDR
ncbi:hypothetical protein [Chryseobacterium glaciei]|uniref:hypothetical protein n=1 Tax=Chryseobacterium glaciei TaxID=1685010 RepID=UPI000B2F792E